MVITEYNVHIQEIKLYYMRLQKNHQRYCKGLKECKTLRQLYWRRHRKKFCDRCEIPSDDNKRVEADEEEQHLDKGPPERSVSASVWQYSAGSLGGYWRLAIFARATSSVGPT